MWAVQQLNPIAHQRYLTLSVRSICNNDLKDDDNDEMKKDPTMTIQTNSEGPPFSDWLIIHSPIFNCPPVSQFIIIIIMIIFYLPSFRVINGTIGMSHLMQGQK